MMTHTDADAGRPFNFRHFHKASHTFTWDTMPNVVFDVKGPFSTAFSDPVAIWYVHVRACLSGSTLDC